MDASARLEAGAVAVGVAVVKEVLLGESFAPRCAGCASLVVAERYLSA